MESKNTNTNMDPNTAMEPQVIHGPIAPMVGGVIYQVTLASGAVLTSPGAFADGHADTREVNPYVTQDGRLLVHSGTSASL